MSDPDPERSRDVEVVLWRGDVTARAEGLRTLRMRIDDDRALLSAAETVRDRTGLGVAVLELTETHLHLELLSPGSADLEWQEPPAPVLGTAPWNRQGWFAATRELIRDALAGAGASRVGPYRQVKHWSISALVQVDSDAGTFWFKQVPAFMAHEGPLTAWLSKLRPGSVPDVVAFGSDWSLTSEFDPPTYERSLDSPFGLLADLQLEARDRIGELLELGCPDRSMATLGADLRAMSERDGFLDDDLAERVHAAGPRIDALVERVETSPIGASLVHGDLHAGNWTRRADGSWLVFDWTDGCVAHPFVDLGVLPTKDTEVREARLEAYLRPWRAAFGDEVVRSALESVLPLADGFHALSYERIVDGVGAEDSASWKPAVAAYVERLLDRLS